MAMTNVNTVSNSEITPIQDREGTQKEILLNATGRSFSAGAAFKRLFSRSPAPADATWSSSDATPSSVLGRGAAGKAALRAGTRG